MAGGGHTASAAMGRRMGRTRQGQRGAVALLWCGRTHGRSGWQQAWGDMDKQQRATKAASAGWKRDEGEGSVVGGVRGDAEGSVQRDGGGWGGRRWCMVEGGTQ